MTIVSTDTSVYSVFGRNITINYSRDALLTPFSKSTLKDRYLWKGEDFQKMFARVAAVNSDDQDHAQRLYDYMSQLWFMPSTPVLSNSGHHHNLPISCFLNEVGDNLEEIFGTFTENNWLAARGGGIGTCWSPVRSIGEGVADRGETSGIIPFVKIMDSSTVGISQGSLRRGSAAVYLYIGHPEIEEFLEIRNPVGGDPHRKSLNVHHAVVIPDTFMEAVRTDSDWHLFSPASDKLISTVRARKLWERLLEVRMAMGEPYLWFVDNVNRLASPSYKANGLLNSTSNLCSEITLFTGIDYNRRRRTAVCCLSSLNLETYDQWKNNPRIVEDALRFLDNVMSHFIKNTDDVPGFERANYAARQERSVGLGVMGFHGFLQSKMIPFEGVMAKVWNKKIFSKLKTEGDAANLKLAIERGSCPDAGRAGLVLRFSHMFAVAPTASISIIANEASPGIDPNVANAYKQKTLSGWFLVKNKWLVKLVEAKYGEQAEEIWISIVENKGSVQHLEGLDEHEKLVFKTAFELDQQWVIEHAVDRTPFICQGQSLNIFLPADVSKLELNKLHYAAWKKGLKGLYYLRSKSIQRATNVSNLAGEMPDSKYNIESEECLACQ